MCDARPMSDLVSAGSALPRIALWDHPLARRHDFDDLLGESVRAAS
jgi:hypothetical protein